MKMGWERRMDGESETRGASVRVELPSNESAPPDSSVLSEPSNTSVQGPATSIMLPEGTEAGVGQEEVLIKQLALKLKNKR